MPGLDEGDAAILCIRRRAIRLGAAGQGLPGRVLHARFQGDLAVLEIAAQGFERPLLTLVREWEVPERGQEVSIAVDPESVLVFPAEGPARMTQISSPRPRKATEFKRLGHAKQSVANLPLQALSAIVQKMCDPAAVAAKGAV